MQGKYSIKIVLPLLVPDMAKAYDKLTLVSDGADAMNTFPRLKEMDEDKRIKYIEPCSTIVESTTIQIKFNQRLEDFRKYSKIDLLHHKDRVDLQTKLLKRKKLLEIEYERLKTYIEERYKLSDLLKN
jgi:hypothetical protein